MMIAFITFKSSLVPLFEGLWSSNSWEFELSGFWRNDDDSFYHKTWWYDFSDENDLYEAVLKTAAGVSESGG